jgi:hypothetical protein
MDRGNRRDELGRRRCGFQVAGRFRTGRRDARAGAPDAVNIDRGVLFGRFNARPVEELARTIKVQ